MKQVKLSDVNENAAPDAGAAVEENTIGVGDVLSDMFKAVGGNVIPFAIIGLLMFVPLVLWAVFFAGGIGALQGDFATYGWTSFLIATVGAIVFSQMAYAAIVCGTVEFQANGTKMGLGAMIAGGFSRLIPVIVCAIMIAIITTIGYFLLIVPGLILAMALSVAIPAIVIENKGPIAALERSIDLTKGNRWQIFGAIILLGLLSFLLGVGGQAVTAALSLGTETTGVIVGAVIYLLQMAISTALGGALSAVLYVHLRENKEGASVAEVAKVFA